MTREAMDVTSAIGGVAGLVSGLYFAIAAARFAKAFVFLANHAMNLARHGKARADLKDNGDT